MVACKWQSLEPRCVTKVVVTKYVGLFGGLYVAKFGIKASDKGSGDQVWWPVSGNVYN
jgi:hypothetical protein